MKRDHDGCAVIIAAMLLAPALLAWSAYVLSILWGWFAVPALNANPIGWSTAYGLTLVAHAVRGYTRTADDKRDESPQTSVTIAILIGLFGPALALLLGWICRP